MDKPTEIQILEILVDNDPGFAIKDAVSIICPLLPNLSKDIITGAIYELKELGKIDALTTDEGVSVLVRPEGHFYLKQLKEAQQAQALLKRDDRRFAWKLAVVGYAAGLFSGILLMWVKSRFFP